MLVNQARQTILRRAAIAPALALPDQPGKVGYILIDARLARQFSAWPHFVSTAPGVAYAYVPDYRRNRPDVYTRGAKPDSAREPGSTSTQRSMPQSPSTMPRCRPRPPSERRPPWSNPVHCAGTGATRCSCTTRAASRWIPSIAYWARRDEPIPRTVRGRLDRPGRIAAERPRPSSRVGFRFGTTRGTIRRFGTI